MSSLFLSFQKLFQNVDGLCCQAERSCARRKKSGVVRGQTTITIATTVASAAVVFPITLTIVATVVELVKVVELLEIYSGIETMSFYDF